MKQTIKVLTIVKLKNHPPTRNLIKVSLMVNQKRNQDPRQKIHQGIKDPRVSVTRDQVVVILTRALKMAKMKPYTHIPHLPNTRAAAITTMETQILRYLPLRTKRTIEVLVIVELKSHPPTRNLKVSLMLNQKLSLDPEQTTHLIIKDPKGKLT